MHDSLETKDFYAVVSKRHNVARLLDFALPEAEASFDSQNAAFAVLTSLVQQYSERKKEGKKKAGDEEDEETVQQEVEEDGEDADSLIEVLASHVSRIVGYLTVSNSGSLSTSYEEDIMPLGSLRLKIIDLATHILKLNKDTTTAAIANSNFFQSLSKLLETYPWNNFLQLKAIAIYEDVLENASPEI